MKQYIHTIHKHNLTESHTVLTIKLGNLTIITYVILNHIAMHTILF